MLFGFARWCHVIDILTESVIVIIIANAIVIATPNDTHKEIAIKAANAGKHIFCEKPISVNLQDAYQMIESCMCQRGLVH